MPRDLWYCHRCKTGEDPVTCVAVREGFIDCADAGRLDKDTFLKVKDVLRRGGLITETAANESDDWMSLNSLWNIDFTSSECYFNGVAKPLTLPPVPALSSRS